MKATILAVALLMGGAAFGQAPGKTPPPAQKQETPAPVSTSIKAPDAFVQKYNQLSALNDVIVELKKDNGIDKLEAKLSDGVVALNKEQPVGFHYNPNTHMFDKNPPEEKK